MFDAAVWRVIWKEYRQQRSLWWAILLLGVFLQVSGLAMSTLTSAQPWQSELFGVALGIPVLYALGCGASLFAGEHEAETFSFQQALPVSAGAVFAGKCLFAAASSVAMAPLLWLLAAGLAQGTWPAAGWHAQLWLGSLFTLAEVLAWTILLSLLLRRVLPAALLGGAVAVLVGYGSLVVVVAASGRVQDVGNEYLLTLPLRGAGAVLAAVSALLVGRRWFEERPWAASLMLLSRGRAASAAQPAVFTTPRLQRLMWHEWRQSRSTIALYLVVHGLLGVWVFSVDGARSGSYLAVLPALATLMGASVFWSDQQQHRYRFFAEHGVRPRLVWLSRQLVWGLPAVLFCVPAWLVAWSLDSPDPPWQVTGLAVIMFAIGQCCSQLIHSGIVAIFVAVLCNLIVFLWITLQLRLGIPYVATCLPVPLIFFGATWLYTPAWIDERATWRVRGRTIASLVVPLLVVCGGAAAYRVYEIPPVVPSRVLAAGVVVDSPAARETARMYEEAESLLRGRTTVDENSVLVITDRDEAWERGIARFLAASQRSSCRFRNWDDLGPRTLPDGQQLTRAILAEARDRNAGGDLDGAAELYLGLFRLAAHFDQQPWAITYHAAGAQVEEELFAELPRWATYEGQTAERIRGLLSELTELSPHARPRWEQGIVESGRLQKAIVQTDPLAVDRFYGVELATLRVLSWLLPWETARARRLIDVAVEADLQGVAFLQRTGSTLLTSEVWRVPWSVNLTRPDGRTVHLSSGDVRRYQDMTPLRIGGDVLVAPLCWEQQRQLVLRRHAAFTQLALLAWHAEHGELPSSLGDLGVQGPPSWCVDPFTERPFVYVREGIEEPIADPYPMDTLGVGLIGAEVMGAEAMGGEPRPPAEATSPESRLPRSLPLLWSPAGELHAPAPVSTGGVSPSWGEFRHPTGHGLSGLSELLRIGRQFFLPVVPPAAAPPPDAANP